MGACPLSSQCFKACVISTHNAAKITLQNPVESQIGPEKQMHFYGLRCTSSFQCALYDYHLTTLTHTHTIMSSGPAKTPF